MSEHPLSDVPRRHSALDTCRTSGTFGAFHDQSEAINFQERAGLFIVQADFSGGDALARQTEVGKALGLKWPQSPRQWVGGDALTFMPAGPGRFWIVGEAHSHDQGRIETALKPHADALVDLSHGRTIIRVTGPNTPYMLAKGTGIDLHPTRFGENASAMTQLFHMGVTLQAIKPANCFDIFVARGYSETLWTRLTDAALEYGYRVLEAEEVQ